MFSPPTRKGTTLYSSHQHEDERKNLNTERLTSSAERRMIRWIGDGCVKEDGPTYGAARQTGSTPNAQRPPSNAPRKTNPLFNLEDRLLAFIARIITTYDAPPYT